LRERAVIVQGRIRAGAADSPLPPGESLLLADGLERRAVGLLIHEVARLAVGIHLAEDD
jgi:hypothetical protein